METFLLALGQTWYFIGVFAILVSAVTPVNLEKLFLWIPPI